MLSMPLASFVGVRVPGQLVCYVQTSHVSVLATLITQNSLS